MKKTLTTLALTVSLITSAQAVGFESDFEPDFTYKAKMVALRMASKTVDVVDWAIKHPMHTIFWGTMLYANPIQTAEACLCMYHIKTGVPYGQGWRADAAIGFHDLTGNDRPVHEGADSHPFTNQEWCDQLNADFERTHHRSVVGILTQCDLPR